MSGQLSSTTGKEPPKWRKRPNVGPRLTTKQTNTSHMNSLPTGGRNISPQKQAGTQKHNTAHCNANNIMLPQAFVHKTHYTHPTHNTSNQTSEMNAPAGQYRQGPIESLTHTQTKQKHITEHMNPLNILRQLPQTSTTQTVTYSQPINRGIIIKLVSVT